ncbi:hypothetical protein HOY82DRAFT_629578 [Tuber indicum]|nr:hypothetical protein HOY82DRAFT_629578 [Tuber indicum]
MVCPPSPSALMAIDHGAPLSLFPSLLSSPLQTRHDVSQDCLRIGFMLQKSKISLQHTPSSNLHFLGYHHTVSSSFHTPPTTSFLASSTLFYCLLRHSVNPK